MAGDPRSVMVFSSPADPSRREQLAERLDALALCDLYDVPPGAFAVVLIGRDGAEQERWYAPVETSELWAAIDGG